jgi:phage-related protein
MENISNTLQVTIDEVKNAISEISKTSANANSAAMQQMQEQIAFATGSISNAISEVKEVMNSITQSSQEQSNQMVAKLTDATEKLGSFLDSTIINLSSSVQNSMKSITDDVNSKQADLLALQEDTTSQTKKLLEVFNSGLDRLEKMNEYVTGTMNSFKQAQGEISISTGNLRTISGDMKLATELFNKGQSDYTEKLNQLQLSSQRGIDQVAEMLKNSGQMTDEYAQKFEVIKQGLSGIFSQLQTGLTEYSRTVQATTQKYLDQYTTNLTQTTDALSSTIQQQNEVVEMLNEILSRKK